MSETTIRFPGIECVACHHEIEPGTTAHVHPTIRGPKGGKKYVHTACGARANPFHARPNMAGRPGKHGLPSLPVVHKDLALLPAEALMSLNTQAAREELARRKASRALRAKMESPSRALQHISGEGASSRPAAGFQIVYDAEEKVHRIFLDGEDTGKYGLSAARAAEISHTLDPRTGERIKPAWMKSKKNPFWR